MNELPKVARWGLCFAGAKTGLWLKSGESYARKRDAFREGARQGAIAIQHLKTGERYSVRSGALLGLASKKLRHWSEPEEEEYDAETDPASSQSGCHDGN